MIDETVDPVIQRIINMLKNKSRMEQDEITAEFSEKVGSANGEF